MTKLDSDIRAAVGRLRASEKETNIAHAAFEEGRLAYIMGIPRENCRFRKPGRKNAWERGWLASEREQAERDSIKTMTEAEKAKARQNLSSLKALIAGDGEDVGGVPVVTSDAETRRTQRGYRAV